MAWRVLKSGGYNCAGVETAEGEASEEVVAPWGADAGACWGHQLVPACPGSSSEWRGADGLVRGRPVWSQAGAQQGSLDSRGHWLSPR